MKSFISAPEVVKEEAVRKEMSLLQEGQMLFDKYYAKRFPNLGEMFSDPGKKRIAAQTCILLENQARYLSKLDEATVTAKFGDIAQCGCFA